MQRRFAPTGRVCDERGAIVMSKEGDATMSRIKNAYNKARNIHTHEEGLSGALGGGGLLTVILVVILLVIIF